MLSNGTTRPGAAQETLGRFVQSSSKPGASKLVNCRAFQNKTWCPRSQSWRQGNGGLFCLLCFLLLSACLLFFGMSRPRAPSAHSLALALCLLISFFKIPLSTKGHEIMFTKLDRNPQRMRRHATLWGALQQASVFETQTRHDKAAKYIPAWSRFSGILVKWT